MKRLSIIFFFVIASVALCGLLQKEDWAKESISTFKPPRALDNNWSKWLVGEWEGSSSSVMGNGKDWMKVERVLDGQFLILKYERHITEITYSQRQYMRETMRLSMGDIDGIENSFFKGIGIHTIDRNTGKAIEYWFDNWRTISKFSGIIKGDKEIMELYGQPYSNISTTEKISEDKLIITGKITMPNGSVTEEKTVMTRKKIMAEK